MIFFSIFGVAFPFLGSSIKSIFKGKKEQSIPQDIQYLTLVSTPDLAFLKDLIVSAARLELNSKKLKAKNKETYVNWVPNNEIFNFPFCRLIVLCRLLEILKCLSSVNALKFPAG